MGEYGQCSPSASSPKQRRNRSHRPADLALNAAKGVLGVIRGLLWRSRARSAGGGSGHRSADTQTFRRV